MNPLLIPSLEGLTPASRDIHAEIDSFNDRYVASLDEKRLNEWPRFFCEKCFYRIHSAENLEHGLPGDIMFADSQEMLKDRILCLTEVSVFEPHRALHVLGRSRCAQGPDNSFIASTNFSVYHTNVEGRSRLFAVGQYRDIVIREQDDWRFRGKVVILDTFNVTSHLAEPL